MTSSRSRWRTVGLTLGFVLFPLLACADRDAIGAGDDETGPPPGEPFAGCIDADDCVDDWCLHPAGEEGFCTYACNGGASSCEVIPGGTATQTCVPVEGVEVCALDCGNGRSCPSHMRCEQISADGEARSICF